MSYIYKVYAEAFFVFIYKKVFNTSIRYSYTPTFFYKKMFCIFAVRFFNV